MEKVIAEVEKVLQENFEGSRIELYRSSSHRVGGSLTWDGFEGMRQFDRQQLLWKVLKQNLLPQTDHQVGTFLTFTPQEVQEMDEMNQPMAA